MAEEKRPLESEPQAAPEASTPDVPGAPAPDLSGDISQPVHDGPAQPDPGDVVISFEKIDELLKERRDAAREKVEQESPPEPSAEGGKEEKPSQNPSSPSPAGAVPRRKRLCPRTRTRRRRRPAGAAHPRLTRRPLTRPRRPNLETKCPEAAAKKLPQIRAEAFPPLLPRRSRLRQRRRPRHALWRRARSSI